MNSYEYKFLEEFCKIHNAGITDFTHKGHCSRCGECCSNLLPLSNSEIENIKHFISEKKIKAKCNSGSSCPFLDAEKKCSIYDIRPLICRVFKCNRKAPTYKEFVLLEKANSKLVNVRFTFFSIA